jgi:uncharacterized membrane protein
LSPRIVAAALGAATIAGALLRFPGLSFESLWIDEIWSGYLVSGSPGDVVRRLVAADNHPPLFHLVQWPFPRLFPVDVGLRLPSAICGVLAIPAMYAAGRRLFDEQVGLLAAWFLALSPFAVHASRDARYYSLLLLLGLLALLAFLRLRYRQDLRSALLFGLALAAILYTQYMGALFVGALLLAGVLESGRVRRGTALAGLTALLLFLPWALAARAGVGNVLGDYWIEPPTLSTAAAAMGGLAVLGRYPWSWPLLPAVLAALIWLGFILRAGWSSSVRICVVLVLTPVIAELLISTLRPLFLARTLIPVIPAILMLAARGALRSRRPRIAAAVLLLTLLPASISQHLVPMKEDWRGAVGYLAAEARPGEPVVVDPFHGKAVEHYGVRDAEFVLLPPRETVADVPGLLRERLGREPETFWLVIRTCDDEDVRTRDLLLRTHDITGSYEKNNAAAFRFRSREKR